MPATDPSSGTVPSDEADNARRWRNRLFLVLGLCVVGAGFETAIAIANDETLLSPALRWVGVLMLLVALRLRPRTMPALDARSTGASGLLTLAAVVAYLAGPLVVDSMAG